LRLREGRDSVAAVRPAIPCLLFLAACARPSSSTDPIRPEPSATSDRSTPTTPETSTTTTTTSRPMITRRDAARRLARAIASDILLYNNDEVLAARNGGAIPAKLAGELAEGRALYRARVSPENEQLYDPAIDEIVWEKKKPTRAP
jgi:hypothetical protein